MKEDHALEHLTETCAADLQLDAEVARHYVVGKYERLQANVITSKSAVRHTVVRTSLQSYHSVLYQGRSTISDGRYAGALRTIETDRRVVKNPKDTSRARTGTNVALDEGFTPINISMHRNGCFSFLYSTRWFQNWGQTVDRRMSHIYTPTSVTDVQTYVRAAVRHDHRIRATGYQHTWSDFYPDTLQVLLTMLPDSLVEYVYFALRLICTDDDAVMITLLNLRRIQEETDCRQAFTGNDGSPTNEHSFVPEN
jgi:hypothetical protein